MKGVKYYSVLIFLYLFCGLVPYLGAFDKVHIQVLYLSVLNVITIGLISRDTNIFSVFNKQLKKLPIFLFFVFFCWSIIAIIPAVNIQSALIQVCYYFIQLMTFIILLYLFSKVKKIDQILKVIVISLTLVELVSTFVPFIDDINTLGQPIPRGIKYRGMTGSVNVLAFSLLIKLMFFYYYIITSRKKILYTIFSTLMIFVIMHITKTRSAIYSLFIITAIFFLFSLIHVYRIKKLDYTKSIKTLFSFFFPIIFVIIFDGYLSKKFEDANSLLSRITSISLTDFSTNSRLRYYKQALETIIEKPILGIGTGNWEIYSVEKDREFMDGYIVPYHVHNDYLEITAESGLVGGILYFSMIFYVLFLLLKKILIKIQLNKDFLYEIAIALAISAYLFDCLFNFPSARAMQQSNLFFVLTLAILCLGNKVKEVEISRPKIITTFLFLLMPLSIYSTVRVYKSSMEQRHLLGFFNYNRMEGVTDLIENYEMDYPSVAVTALPLKSIKGVYYFKQGDYEKAIDLLNEGRKYNPYTYLTETFKGMAYMYLEDYDSARYYTKLAYNKIPNNMLHLGHYFNVLANLKDSLTIKSVYEAIPNKDKRVEEIYIITMSDVLDKDEANYADIEKLDLNAISASNLYLKAYYKLKVGYDEMMTAATNHALGEYHFQNNQFEEALAFFELASTQNPYELPYQENLANTHLQLKNNNEAITTINKMEASTNELSPKSKYIRALAYISIGNKIDACIDLNDILDAGLIDIDFYNNFCSNINIE